MLACDGAIGGVKGSESDDNNKGIGFERHDDTWLPLQSNFQRVLAALNIQHGGAGKEMSETEKKDNLKELSIQSKKLLHHQKSGRSLTTCPGLSTIISTS